MKDKFNYTATELLFYICPCCLHKWKDRKPDYCPNCEVRITYESPKDLIDDIIHDMSQIRSKTKDILELLKYI